jgi:hypothetical protein
MPQTGIARVSYSSQSGGQMVAKGHRTAAPTGKVAAIDAPCLPVLQVIGRSLLE